MVVGFLEDLNLSSFVIIYTLRGRTIYFIRTYVPRINLSKIKIFLHVTLTVVYLFANSHILPQVGGESQFPKKGRIKIISYYAAAFP